MKILYFTATGNSLYVAKRIGGELYSIPKMMKEGKFEFEDDTIGLVFPCYGWGMPRLVAEFIKKAKLKAGYLFAVMTYGKVTAGGLDLLAQAGARAGINFNYTNALMMIDNYLPMFDMEDELKHEGEKRIEENLSKIIADIKGRKNMVVKKGLFQMINSFMAQLFFYKRAVDKADRAFIVTDECNGCKICEKVCPKDNIRVEKKPVYLHKCDVCYACIQLCPANAIHLENEKSRARFINPNIQLQEIVEANWTPENPRLKP